MPEYRFRADRSPVHPRVEERFDAVDDAAAIEATREMLLDEGADEGDGGTVYRIDEGDRGDEEFVADVRLGDDDEGDSKNKVEMRTNGDIVVGDGVSNVWVRMGGLTIQLSQGGDCGTAERPTVMIDAWADDDSEGVEPLGTMEVGRDFATFSARQQEIDG